MTLPTTLEVAGVAAVAILLLSTCSRGGDSGDEADSLPSDASPQASSDATATTADATNIEDPNFHASATVPTDLDIRLTRRDTTPLGDDVLIRFQQFNRGPDPRHNYRWELALDGSVHYAGHSDDTSDPDTPFDTPLPAEPTVVLDQQALDVVAAALDASNFADQPRYQLQADVEDGTFTVVTARLPSGAVREVIYDAAWRPPVGALELLTERILEESS
jgi:hypothetical protein